MSISTVSTVLEPAGGAGEASGNDIDSFWASKTKSKKKKTQLERYIENGSPPGILKFIEIGGGPRMGATLEEFAKFRFKNLIKRKKGKTETGYDHLLGDVFVEQKSSGLWNDNSFKWQHVEIKHKWNMLLLCGIGYKEIHFWALSKSHLSAMISAGKIKNQGNAAGDSTEGVWFTYSDVKDFLTEIRKEADLSAFALTLTL